MRLGMIGRFGAVAVALAVAFEGCSSSSSTANHTGGTLVVGVPFSVASLDPHRNGEDTTILMVGQVYDTLVHVNPDDPTKIDPGLAESWSASDQNTVFTFHLRKNARFSSGNPVTADDVKFSFDRDWNLQGSPSLMFDGFKSIDVIDQYTVQITMEHPDAALLSKLTSDLVVVIDSKVAKANGGTSGKDAATTDKLQAYFDSVHSLGSGPFILTSYVPNDQFVLERNPKYWGTPPSLDKVIIKSIPDATTSKQLLERGDLDIATTLDYTAAQELESNSDVNISYAPSLNLIYLFMNTSPSVSPQFSNKLVRQAVSHAINYSELMKLANGHATKPPTTIPLGLLAADAVQAPTYDVNLAKQLMSQAGYASGFDVKFIYPAVIKFSVDYGLIAAKVQSDLAQIGIKLHLQPATQAEFLAAYRAKTDPFGISFDSADYPDTDDFVGPFWSSDVNFFTKRLNYKNPAIDALYPQSLSTSGDARAQVYKQMEALFVDDPVTFGLMVPQYILASRKRVHGYRYIWDLRQVDFSKISVS